MTSRYIDRIDYNKIPWSELDWMIRSWYPKINQAKRLIPKMLSEKGLVVNLKDRRV